MSVQCCIYVAGWCSPCHAACRYGAVHVAAHNGPVLMVGRYNVVHVAAQGSPVLMVGRYSTVQVAAQNSPVSTAGRYSAVQVGCRYGPAYIGRSVQCCPCGMPVRSCLFTRSVHCCPRAISVQYRMRLISGMAKAIRLALNAESAVPTTKGWCESMSTPHLPCLFAAAPPAKFCATDASGNLLDICRTASFRSDAGGRLQNFAEDAHICRRKARKRCPCVSGDVVCARGCCRPSTCLRPCC
jgi:hypothetical protein